MKQFEINYYFTLYKDRSISSCRIFRGYMKIKHNVTDIKFVSELYSKINKYQVKKYGGNVFKSCSLVRDIGGRCYE